MTLDLSGGAGTGSTSYVEDATATLFPVADLASDGVDDGLVDTVTIELTGWTATMLLALDATAALAAAAAGVASAYASGVLTLSLPFGGDPVADADWETILRGIVFSDSSEDPPAGPIDVEATATHTSFNSGVDTHSITITSVNDAPSGAENSVDTLEDQALVFAMVDFGFSDLDGDDLLAVQIVTLPSIGVLALDGVAVIAGQYVAAADITDGLLQFTPEPDDRQTAYASFQFRVQDDGGIASGGIDLSVVANNMTINVTSVNDAPAGSAGTVQALEDLAYSFTASDFGFSDTADGDDFNGVRVATLPTVGVLTNNGVAVVAGDTIGMVDLTAGKFKYTGATDDFGTGYASFTFQVRDDGGLANGGVNLDPTPATMTIDVASRPDVVSVEVYRWPSQALLTVPLGDADAGSGIYVQVKYDESVVIGAPPSLSFSPDVASSLAPWSAPTWFDTGFYGFWFYYDVSDAGFDADGVDVTVSGAQNGAGNVQDDETFADVLSIDTLNPTVLSVSVSDATVGPQNVSSPFQVFITFSEAMDTSAAPTITLNPAMNALDLQANGGAWSLGGTVYTANYIVKDRAMDIGPVSIDVSGTKDTIGNPQQDYAPLVEFDFDTFHFEGDVYANQLVGNTYAHWFLGDNSVDTLQGNIGNDTLDGGQWGDSMVGGNGSDTYYVDNTNDKAIETVATAAGGTDLVISTVNFTLGNNVENLTLSGALSINGKGNTVVNVVTGNGGANQLFGLAGNDTLLGAGGNDSLTGGAGNDSLNGGSGNDIYVFDTALGATNVDRIASFDSDTVVDAELDQIRLLRGIFTTLTTGTLAATAFENGDGIASTAAHRILLDASGNLWYDRDGTGIAARVQFGVIESAGLVGVVSASDFVVTLV